MLYEGKVSKSKYWISEQIRVMSTQKRWKKPCARELVLCQVPIETKMRVDCFSYWQIKAVTWRTKARATDGHSLTAADGSKKYDWIDRFLRLVRPGRTNRRRVCTFCTSSGRTLRPSLWARSTLDTSWSQTHPGRRSAPKCLSLLSRGRLLAANLDPLAGGTTSLRNQHPPPTSSVSPSDSCRSPGREFL